MIYLFQYIDNSDKLAEATEEEPAALDAFVQARISYEIQEPNDGTKLSPFPSMCDWCRRRKSSKEKCCKKSRDIDKANLNNDHRNSVLNGDASQMVISVKEYNACSKSLANNSHLKEDTSQVLDKQINTASYGNKIITSKHLERDVVSNQRSSLPENNSETNNSHLMRDRNSNYYSLQSRNGDSIRARCSDRQTHILAVNQRNNTKNTAPTSLNKGFDNEKQADIVDVESNISDLGGVEMEDHDVSTFHLAFDSDSEMETETEGKSSIVAVHNEDPKVHEDLEGNLSEMDTKSNHITVQYQNIKVQKDAIQGKHSELVSKSTHQGSKRLQSKSSTGCIKQSGTRNNVENVNHGQVQDNIPTQGSH